MAVTERKPQTNMKHKMADSPQATQHCYIHQQVDSRRQLPHATTGLSWLTITRVVSANHNVTNNV